MCVRDYRYLTHIILIPNKFLVLYNILLGQHMLMSILQTWDKYFDLFNRRRMHLNSLSAKGKNKIRIFLVLQETSA